MVIFFCANFLPGVDAVPLMSRKACFQARAMLVEKRPGSNDLNQATGVLPGQPEFQFHDQCVFHPQAEADKHWIAPRRLLSVHCAVGIQRAEKLCSD